MPARKRAQEARRRLRRAVREAHERDLHQFQTASEIQDHLSDTYWREHENPNLCSCYADQDPHVHALREIDEWLRSTRQA